MPPFMMMSAMLPKKHLDFQNFTGIIPKELAKDEPDVLIIQSGSVDITNLNQIPCLDDKSSTPPGVKPKLSEMFNSNLD